MPKKLTFEYVKNYFEEQGCELLEKEYVNCKTKMKYICNCGNISKISFDNFKKGKRCRKCSKSEKHTFRYIKQYFKKQKCELLEKKYKNNKTKMRYRCKCKNISEISFDSFKKGTKCQKCAGIEKLTFKYVQQYFKKHNCELLETKYKNNNTKMKYKCFCGNISEIRFDTFKNGGRCLLCAAKRRKQSMLKEYGVPTCFNCGYSKESQKLFDAIYQKINKRYKNKTYYATLNKEFTTTYKNKCFKYDYVNSKFKKAIEYNGSSFHPQEHMKDEEIKWCLFHPSKTVKEARDYEKIKYEGLEKRGYKILTVWDYELHKDFNTLVDKCLSFLTS